MLVSCMPCCLCTVSARVITVCIALQVYFVCSDGSLFVLCPVAPFQAAVPISDVSQLVDISRCCADESAHSTTQAWLDQVTTVQPLLPPSVHPQVYPLLWFCACTLVHINYFEGVSNTLLSLFCCT